MMEDIGFERKDKRSKSKKLNQFTSTALNQKVGPHMFLESSNALIYKSGTEQSQVHVQKKYV